MTRAQVKPRFYNDIDKMCEDFVKILSYNDWVCPEAKVEYAFPDGIYFDKVSFHQFASDWIKAFPEYADAPYTELKDIYDKIELPTRSSTGSAGYDFKCPINVYFKPKHHVMIPTGIRAIMPKDVALFMYARSGLGSKYGLTPRTQTSIIDSDYSFSDNEGHIKMCMINNGDERVVVEQGQGFCQGVFQNYLITSNDNVTAKRNGGFGSSDGSFAA